MPYAYKVNSLKYEKALKYCLISVILLNQVLMFLSFIYILLDSMES